MPSNITIIEGIERFDVGNDRSNYVLRFRVLNP